MIEAWGWTENDVLLHVLPLNHVHGLLNCLLTPLYANARVHMMEKFNAALAWENLLDESSDSCTIFQAVPTVYVQLVNEYYINLKNRYSKEKVQKIFKGKIRVCISGSAPLNQQTYHDWYEITGMKILERYGMTETGMSLSSPLIETKKFKRIPGLVGRPMPEVKVRIVDALDESKVFIESNINEDKIVEGKFGEDIEGNLEVKGPNVFKEYFNKEKQTKETFTNDNWFKTGDSALFVQEYGSYKILGRTSIDIIKSGGYKISAVDIEREISAHPNIFDVIVFGVKDLKWGEKICAYIKLKNKDVYNQVEFIEWCKKCLPKQSVPRIIKVFDEMPRNHIGKVNKKELVKQYEKENPT
jgi:malonyl-CoA/methylmalonyl-CoA synthetase